jgi:UDP-N-acetylmuramoyl-tripeptide--D-alanyl-D-alanine ligase
MIKQQYAFLTSDRVQEYTHGRWLNLKEKMQFTGVSYGQYIKGNIYFPVNPNNINIESINKYIAAGIKAIVLENEDLSRKIDIPVLLVDKITIALSKTGKAVRREVNPKTVLITGTEGKTGTKLQLGQLLGQQTSVHFVPNSQNNLHSIYRSLADIGETDTVELTEVGCGANTNLNRTRGKVINPDIVFYTQIGLAHMDFHKTLEGLLTNKAAVLAGLKNNGICIVNSSISCFDEFIDKIKCEKPDVNILTYGEHENDIAYVVKKEFDLHLQGWRVEANIENEIISFFHPLFHQFVPIMSVGILLVIKRLGFNIQQAARDFLSFKAYETMGQLLKIKKNTADIWFYNQSRRGGGINSIVSAFMDLNNFKITGKVVALLGSMSIKEDEKNTLMLHQHTAIEINNSQISRLYTTGIHMDIVQKNLDEPSVLVKHSDNYEELMDDIINDLNDGDMLFIKGHASLNLARLAKMILNKKEITHPYKVIKGLITQVEK